MPRLTLAQRNALGTGSLAALVPGLVIYQTDSTPGLYAYDGTAGAPQVGLLAQDVEKIYPELVATDKDGYKAVNYAQLTPVLIEALKEQQAQIETLKQEAAAKAEVAALRP